MALSAAGNLALPLATLLSAPLLARALGVEGRGDLAAATAPLMLLVTVASFGIPEAITVAIARTPASRRLATRNGMLVLLLSGGIAVVAAILIAPLVTTGSQTVTVAILFSSIAIIPTVLVGALRGSASGLHRWGLVNLEKTVNGTARLAGTVVLFMTGTLTVATATFVIAISPVLAAIAYIPLVKGKKGSRSHETPAEDARIPALTRYGFRQWLGSVSGILLSRIDQLIMAPLVGAAQLGFYAVAVNVADVTLLANNAVRDVTLASDAQKRSDELLAKSARASLLVSAAVGLLVAGSTPLWFTLVFGEDFSGAIPVSVVLVAASVLGVPGSVAGAGLAARGKPELRSLSIFVALIVNVVILLALLPIAGAMGAAWATLVGNVIAANLNIYFCRRLYGMRFGSFYAVRYADLMLIVSLAKRILGRG